MRREVVMGEGCNMDSGAYGRTHLTLIDWSDWRF